MLDRVFDTYSHYYDLLYKDKNYFEQLKNAQTEQVKGNSSNENTSTLFDKNAIDGILGNGK